MIGWSLPPLLLYVAFRRYLQAMGIVRPVTYTLIAANIVNAVANWILIFGHLGFPALGVRRIRVSPRCRRACVMAVALFGGHPAALYRYLEPPLPRHAAHARSPSRAAAR